MENNPHQKGEQGKCLIIGGGAAGYFAAIAAAEAQPDMEVVILEQGKDTLQKVRISGGGRCNVTHGCFDPRELVEFYPRGKQALRGPFTKFCTGDTMEWFESRGVPLKIEDDGRVFPISDNSQSIIDCLETAAKNAGVSVQKRTKVVQLYPPEEEGQRWKVMTINGQAYYADAILVAAGSSKFVWDLISHLGHTIVDPVPSLFTFNIPEKWLHQLAGIAVPLARVRVPEASLEESGPMLITHWGLSGPAILKMSAWGARNLHQLNYEFEVVVNWLGFETKEAVLDQLKEVKSNHAKKRVVGHSAVQIPGRLWKAFCEQVQIAEDLRWADINKQQLQQLATYLTEYKLPVHGKSTFKEEFVTAGGVALDEVNFKNFESRIHKDLYFAGEVLNIDAVTGGFNFQAAWTGGWIAGLAMAQSD